MKHSKLIPHNGMALVTACVIGLLAISPMAPAEEQNAGKQAALEQGSDAGAAEAAEAKAEKKSSQKAEKQSKKRKMTAAERAAARGEQRKKKTQSESGKARYAEFVLDGALPESPGGSGLFSELGVDLRKQIARIDQAASDDSIEGLVLRLSAPQFGRGQLNELREAIHRFRAEGKHAVAEMEVATGGAYQLACACDQIVMPESGYLMLTGIRAEPLFYKGMLAKIGVKADFVHVGEAKGAAEPYTRRKWSEPVKQNITSMIDDIYDQMIDTIAMERPIKRIAAIEAIDRGLLTATAAKEAGLVDRLAYPSELRSSLSERHDGARVVFVENYGKKKVDTDFSGPAGFFKLMGMIAGGGDKPSRSSKKKLALVYATGPIMSGESETDPFGQSSPIGSTTIVNALRDAADDDRVAAIVLRVDSPGGSAVASDMIWNQIRCIDKPVVASMGNVAASGGYYISMGADHVFAEPTTVTGSIGVVGGKMALSGLFDKLGITSDLISRGENSGLFSAMNKFTKSERAVLVALMDDTYEQFTAKAAEGRGLSQDRIKQLGGGKVYTGRQAEELGLVDELGDLKAAIAKAKQLAGLDPDEKLGLDTYPEAPDFFEALFENNAGEKEVRTHVRHALSLGGLAPELADAAERASWLRQLFTREPVAVLMPFELQVK